MVKTQPLKHARLGEDRGHREGHFTWRNQRKKRSKRGLYLSLKKYAPNCHGREEMVSLSLSNSFSYSRTQENDQDAVWGSLYSRNDGLNEVWAKKPKWGGDKTTHARLAEFSDFAGPLEPRLGPARARLLFKALKKKFFFFFFFFGKRKIKIVKLCLWKHLN